MTEGPVSRSRYERVQVALQAAERLLEEKSRQLYRLNIDLKNKSDSLERLVQERTWELSQALEMSQAATRAKDLFLANMSHEVRTPLHGVIGSLQLFEESDLSPINKDLLETIRSCSRSLLEIVNTILDFSKLQADAPSTTKTDFAIRPLLADVLAQNVGLSEAGNIDVLVRVDERLPMKLFSDSFKIEHILNNLISNALKFTEVGSVMLEVRRHPNTKQDDRFSRSVEFILSDTGVGIKEEDLPKLFEPFRQVDGSLTRRHMGTGLGLSIVRKLVEHLDGEVTIKSEYGVGTTFKVTLPEAIKDGGAEDQGSSTGKVTPPEIFLFGEYSTCFRASLLLAQLGKATRIIRTPSEAEAFLLDPAQSAKAVIIDRRFGGDAVDWLNRLQERGNLGVDAPVVVIRGTKSFPHTALGQNVHEVEGRFSRSSLLEMLQNVAPSLGLTRLTAREPASAETSDVLDRISKLCVLVVDDNSINQRVLARLLGNAGVRNIESASSAADAMALLGKKEFDVAFMDVQMPDIDGYTATRMIREKGYSKLKVFACSAHAFETDIKRSLDEGMDGHISKPVDVGELTALLRGIVLSS